MAEIGQGRMGTLFIIIMSLFILMVALAFSFYSIKTGGRRAETKQSPEVVRQTGYTYTPGQTRQTEAPQTNEAESLLPTIKKIRVSLAKFLPEARETAKFRSVFDGLEISALRNEIDISALDLFTKSLKPALEDNIIDQSEMEALLELLESAMIN